MSVFAIGDLHLSFSSDKPMDIFRGWDGYVSKLEKNWKSIINDDDIVVLCGDISWAMRLEDTYKDFAFINTLPGKKLIIKGNHDYWWTTMRKMEQYLEKCGFNSIGFIHNSAYDAKKVSICGTRGWSYDAGEDEAKFLNREAARLGASIEQALKNGNEPVVFLHYPPVYGDYVCEEIIGVLKKYGIKRCFYGHLHGQTHGRAFEGERDGVIYRLISGDYINFCPALVEKD